MRSFSTGVLAKRLLAANSDNPKGNTISGFTFRDLGYHDYDVIYLNVWESSIDNTEEGGSFKFNKHAAQMTRIWQSVAPGTQDL